MAALAAAASLAGCDNISIGGSAAPAGQAEAVAPEQLRAAVSDPRVRAFYEARSWQPAWSGEQEQRLRAAIGEAVRHALDPDRFLGPVERASGAAEREAALSLAAISYADALARGLADPRRLHEIYELPRAEANVAAGLNEALQDGGNLPQWFAGLAPADAEYRALSEAYVRLRRDAGTQRAEAIAAGDSIRIGDRDPRIPAVVAALRSNGYLPPAPPQQQGAPKAAVADGTRYTPEIGAAVRRLQQDYGLGSDAVIGGETLDAINFTPFDRARQIAVNLERRRWLARETAPTRIDVNTAAAFLEYWRDGSLADSRVVMVGQPEWETPPLASPLVRLVANPPWTVPESIEREELLPKGAAYLARNNISRKNGRLVQEPGPDSALGLVKFDMANRHAIYLHDTPHKALFQAAARHVSHGCVRVSDAIGFARLIARHEGKLEEFDEKLATREENGIALARPIPVRLLYHSVYVDRGGQVRFRPDAYGWDERVAQALGLAPRQSRPLRRHVNDIGP